VTGDANCSLLHAGKEKREKTTADCIDIWSRECYWLWFIDPTPANVSAPFSAIIVYFVVTKYVRYNMLQYCLKTEYFIF
jgi:hypothetical protein